MAGVRKPCRIEGCLLPKSSPSHHCEWHRLEREPIDRQVSASKLRLAMVPDDLRLSRVDSSLWPPGFRFCAGCQSMVPAFYTSGSRCYACASAASHGAMIEKTYQLTADQYAALLELQDGKCAVCRQKPVSKRLAVDHDHVTGRVRGLLCSGERGCNRGILGSAHDDVSMLKSAVAYLEHPPMSGEWKTPNLRPRAATRARRNDPAESDPSYLMFDHEGAARPLPSILQDVVKKMTVDQLVLSGGRSDPETGIYWLAYRREADETPPF